jgi:hypothetical protein
MSTEYDEAVSASGDNAGLAPECALRVDRGGCIGNIAYVCDWNEEGGCDRRDVFSWFKMTISVPAETAADIAEVPFEWRIAVFGPPVHLLLDRRRCLCRRLCRISARGGVGTKKVYTSPYALQTEGMVKRFNAMLYRDLAKFVTHEEDWDRHLAFAVFRYIASCKEETGVSPFRVIFDVDPYEFDVCLGLELRLKGEPHDLAQRLAEVHGKLYNNSMRSRAPAHLQYNKAVQMFSYAVGDRVLIYHTHGETESGRILRVPWIGAYRITERHLAVWYFALSELEGKTAHVHINHFKAVPERREVDASGPEQGLWPDVRRVLRGVLSRRTVRDGVEYQVRKAG